MTMYIVELHAIRILEISNSIQFLFVIRVKIRKKYCKLRPTFQ